jgi:hypothetical protein
MPAPKHPGKMGMRVETKEAKRLFLYGDGTGERVTNAEKLAKLSGVHVTTIYRNMPAWEKEYEEILTGGNSRNLAIALSKEKLDLHNSCIDTLENQIKQAAWELEQFDEITSALEKICDNFSLNTDNGDAALRLFENYLSSRGAKDTLRKTFMAMHKHYTDLTGIKDLLDLQATSSKELEKGRVRLRLKEEAAKGSAVNVTPEDERLSVFDR